MGKKSATALTHLYQTGDLVFVKIRGSPHWPAKIESISIAVRANKRYNIRFYGTNQKFVAKDYMIQPYNQHTLEIYGKRKRINSFNNALDEIENELSAKRIKTSEIKQQSAKMLAISETEKTINEMFKKFIKKNIEKHEDQFEKVLPEVSDLLVTHSEGKRSYEIFCKYLSQFEAIKSDHIKQIKSVYQHLTSQIVPQIQLGLSDVKLKEADLKDTIAINGSVENHGCSE